MDIQAINNIERRLRLLESVKDRSGTREYRQSWIGCSLTHSVNLAIASSGALPGVAHTFDTEIYDGDPLRPMHDGANPTRITIPKAGYYLVSGAVIMTANVTGTRFLGVRKNGAGNLLVADQESPAHGQTVAINCSNILKFAANDYIELMVFQNSGVAVNSEARPDYAALFECHIVS